MIKVITTNKNIKAVMQSTGCSYGLAVKTLLKENNNVPAAIQAIIKLQFLSEK